MNCQNLQCLHHYFYTKSPLPHYFYKITSSTKSSLLQHGPDRLWEWTEDSLISSRRTVTAVTLQDQGTLLPHRSWSQRTPMNTHKSHQWPQQLLLRGQAALSFSSISSQGSTEYFFFFLLLNSCRCGPEFCKSKIEGANIPVPFLIHPFEMLKCH